MTRAAAINIATLYSSAQCVLSVVGSVGVILLFAGIPQLIYSPTVSVANLMTFLLGAILITTMVAGNSFLNYKYRKFTRASQQSQRDANSSEAAAARAEAEDKPPSYEAILSSDGLPPDYFSILCEKPPRYEDVAGVAFNSGTFLPAVPLETDTSTTTTTTTTTTTGTSSEVRNNTNQPKEVATESEIGNTSSRTKKEDAATSLEVTRVTIGYDNDAYSPQGDVSLMTTTEGGVPAMDNLRESES